MSATVLLMTIGTGAVGQVKTKTLQRIFGASNTEGRLNLTAANRIHIVEPQWNPSVEEQAVARAVRMGQTRTVTITRYVVEKSVEEVSFQRNE